MQKRSLSSPTYNDNGTFKKPIRFLSKIPNKDNMFQNEYGMTLIETLITIVILSLALLSLSGMQVSAFYVSNNSKNLMSAVVITQDTIELLMSIDFRSGHLSDTTPVNEYTQYELSKATLNLDPPPGVQVRWEVDDQNDGTKLINVTTTWQNRGEKKSLVLPLRRTFFQ